MLEIVTVFLLPTTTALPLFPFVLITAVVLFFRGLVGDLGDDVSQEVEDLIFGHGSLEMDRSDAFRGPVSGLL